MGKFAELVPERVRALASHIPNKPVQQIEAESGMKMITLGSNENPVALRLTQHWQSCSTVQSTFAAQRRARHNCCALPPGDSRSILCRGVPIDLRALAQLIE